MKKGALSIETLVIIILAVVVLAIVAISFSQGFTATWNKILGIEKTYTQADFDSAKAACDQFCATSQYYNWCNSKAPLAGDKKCDQLGSSCAVNCAQYPA